MTGPLTRREFVRVSAVGTVLGSAGCLDQGTGTSATGASASPLAGVVRDLQDEPVEGARVAAVRSGDEPLAKVRTGADGRFELGVDGPVWLRVTAEEHSERVTAASPERDRVVRLSPDDAVSLQFGGDVMFGRRFYEESDDHLSTRAHIDEPTPDSHASVLADVAPLLGSADLTSVNLETPLTDVDWRHPEKAYTFTSHPSAAPALADAGVDYVALANNHVLDALEPGFTDTVDALSAADLAYSGAGEDSASAWEPATLERGGQEVAFVSCSEVAGTGYEIDWSADSDPDVTHEVTRNGETITFSGSLGVAEPTTDRLAAAVERARAAADVVVVQIHGGDEYRHEPTEPMERFVAAASRAGADVVANHHPHVPGGVEFREGTLVAWSLGNLVFDQEFWETLRSYVLSVDVTESGVVRASVEPVVLDGYVPSGITGPLRSSVLRETAGRSSAAFDVGPKTLEHVSERSSQGETTVHTVSGSPALFAVGRGWVDEVVESPESVLLGRERLLTGGFGDYVGDEQRYEGPLWRFGREADTRGPETGFEDGGVRLRRERGDEYRKLLSPRYRIPVEDGPLTFTGLYSLDTSGGLEVLVSWYEESFGESFEQERFQPPGTDGKWQRFRRRFEPPSDAEYVNLWFFLSPPTDADTRTASVDDLRLVEWDSTATGGRQYDHLAVDGSARVRLTSDVPDGTPTWRRLNGRTWEAIGISTEQ